MVSAQHRDWINRGKPDSGLALPLAQLRDALRAHGFTVYDQPDDGHLDAEPPEDHTPYSETGWPGPSPKWWRHAIDIMPKTEDAAGAAGLKALGARIVADRNAGRITWLKYINWPATGSLSQAQQDRWEPGHQARASGDAGHIHMSSITGVENLDAPYDPFAEAAGETMALSRDDVINVASAVVQWATVDGALPGNFRGAGTNLLSLEAQNRQLSSDLAKLSAVVAEMAATLKQVLAAQAVAGQATGDVTVSGTLHLGGPGGAS